jgi:DNA-binding PadR family transcriptional regulator
MSRSKQFSKPGRALTAPVVYVLLALSLKDRHGYDILKFVEANSEGRVRLGPGTLYTTLKRMLDAGLISELAEPPDSANDDARRRYYRLSRGGRAELASELKRMEQALELAGSRTRPHLRARA